MNKAQLQKLAWKHVKLRPIAKRIDHLTGMVLEQIDDQWLVSATNDPKGLPLSISRTGHGFTLPYDHIREYLSDTESGCAGFLILKVQVHLKGNWLWVEPLLT